MRLFANRQDTPKQYKTRNKFNILSANKGVKIINLPKIVRSKNVLSKILSNVTKDDIPMGTYKL